MGDLHYGHLGALRYDELETKWSPQKDLDSDGSWRAFTPLEIHVSPCVPSLGEQEPTSDDTYEKSLMWRDMRQTYPETAPVRKLLQGLARFDRVYQHDVALQLSDRLLDSTNVGASRHWPEGNRLFAFATGPAGATLGLAFSRPLRKGWRDDSQAWISTVHLAESNMNTWNAGQGQIKQLYFHPSSIQSYGKPTLVVRFEKSVSLLRLVPDGRGNVARGWRKSYQYAVNVDRREMPLRFMRLGTHIADLTTRPSDPCQITVVHRDGRFALWRVNPKDKTHLERMVCESSLDSRDGENLSLLSEWHRVFWLPSENRIAICNRFKMEVFEVGDRITKLGSPIFPGPSRVQTIHAAKQNPFNRSEIFIVSSTSIHWLCEDAQALTMEQSQETGLKEIARWKHSLDVHRSFTNINFCSDAAGVHLLLSSSDAPFLLKYAISRPKRSALDTTTISLYPSLLDLPSDLRKCPLVALISVPCPIEHSERADGSSLGLQYSAQGTKFFQLFVLDRELSLKSILYYFKRPTAGEISPVEPLLWSLVTFRSKLTRWDKFVREDFVQADDDTYLFGDENELSKSVLRSFRRLNNNELGSNKDEGTQLARTVPNERIYQEIIKSDNHSSELDAALAALGSTEHTSEERDSPHATLLSSQLGLIPALSNIDLSEQALKDFAASYATAANGENGPSKLSMIPMPLPSGFEALSLGSNASPLSAFYRGCIETWLRTLPDKTPIAARLAKERAARYVTTAVCLSIIRIDPPSILLQSADPIREATPSQPPTDAPSPSPHQASTLQAGPSQAQSPSPKPIAAALARLGRYASLSQASQPSDAFDHLASRVLSTWKVGASETPDAMLASLSKELAGSSMDAETRARQLRRLEKRKQLESRTRASLAKRPRLLDQTRFEGRTGIGGGRASSPVRPPPERWMPSSQSQGASQNAGIAAEKEAPHVGVTARGADSQATAQSDSRPERLVMASQVEPGRHGGRPLMGLPVRRKPRKPGF